MFINIPRLLIAILAGFAFIFGTDFLIHGIWLTPDYKATASLWRPESEMQRRFFLLLFSQFLGALSFLYIWARTGWRRRSIVDGCAFGFWMGLFQQTTSIVLYVVTYMPWQLTLKWFVAGVVQATFLGALSALIYKPKPTIPERRAS